jgi:hypothetical protein
MADAIERRHDIGCRQRNQHNHSQNPDDAQIGVFCSRQSGVRVNRRYYGIFPRRVGSYSSAFKAPPTIDEARVINDCPTEFDPGAAFWSLFL